MSKTILAAALAALVAGASGCGRSGPADASGEFEGEWAVREMSENGKAVALSDKLKIKALIKDQKFSLLQEGGGKARNDGTFAVRVDPTPSPGHFDLVRLDGAESGKARLGVFARDGDTVTVVLGALGGKRAGQLAPGENTTFLVLERLP